jgi:hypothetical protein
MDHLYPFFLEVVMNAMHVVGYVVGGLTLVGAASTTQAAWMAPIGGWQLAYEASSGNRPDQATPAWTIGGGYQSTNSAGDNYSAIVTDSVTSEQTLYLGNTSASDKWPTYSLSSGNAAGMSSDKITLDFRFRLVDAAQGNYQWALAVDRPSAGSGSNSFLLNFGLGHVQNGNTGDYQGVTLGTDWHDARLLIDAATDTANLYLDGDSTPTFTVTGTNTAAGTANDVWFGDGQGSVLGKAEVSYIRLTNNEFASVVPEPASIGLLALGGSLFMMKRRRRRQA